MKNIFSLCFLLLLVGQSKSQSVLGAAGGEGQAGSMHLSYTAGEAVISTVENDSTVLTQGFHQPNYVVTALEYTFLPGAVSVFPNPTSALLNVRLAGLPMENVTITLFDPAGRLMLTAKMDADLWQTNLADWPGGCYWLRVSDAKTRQSGSFKIFKSN